MQVLPFMPSLEFYLRNSLLTVARSVTSQIPYFHFNSSAGAGNIGPLPPGEGEVSRGKGQRPC
jgi:hypothetical protein